MSRVVIIAEMGINHQGNLDLARKLIAGAKSAGADWVKGQKRCIREYLTPEQYDRPYDSPHAFGPTYGLHKEALEFSQDQWRELFQFAEDVGIPIFTSVMDITSARQMRELGMEMFKIGSGELNKWELLKEIRSYGKPILLSTGMSTLEEIRKAVDILKGADVTLMHCTSVYPCPSKLLNLRVIPTLIKEFALPVGFSGHHSSVGEDLAAVALGACVVERHFTIDRTMKGTDQAASLEPTGMNSLVRHVRAVEEALGSAEKVVLPEEVAVRKKVRGY
jgi:sialic acid synthase SpsE